MSGRSAKTVLFMAPYPRGQAPSQRFRFEQFYDALDRAGVAYRYNGFWNDDAWRVLYKPGHRTTKVLGLMRGLLLRLSTLFVLHRYDVVHVHREMAPLGPPVFEWIVARLFGKPIVYDFDDAIWLPNVSDANRAVGGMKWHSKVASICAWSRRVVCGNAYLADYALRFNEHVVVIPTVLDTAGLHVRTGSSGDVLVIGWTGSHSTVDYLQPIVPALRELAKAVEFRFRVIADRRPSFDVPNLEFVEWRKESEIEDLSAIDIGVMPMPHTEWARGKCGLKILQYMAMGIPTVADAVGVNGDIIRPGTDGWLAATPQQWTARLRDLAVDGETRRRMGAAARERVVAEYSVEANTEKFLAAVTDV